jgi:hypothetical protein
VPVNRNKHCFCELKFIFNFRTIYENINYWAENTPRSEGIAAQELPSKVDEVRDALTQFFRDRRIDSCGELTKRFID